MTTFRIARDNARAQAAELLAAQRARELRECLARFRAAREKSYAGEIESHGPSQQNLFLRGTGDDRTLRLQNAGGGATRCAEEGRVVLPSGQGQGQPGGAKRPARQQDLAAQGKGAAESGVGVLRADPATTEVE